ncbi:MAG: HI0074 family nucleotidyltransferase substrate-binding subunit [Alphaproteobacteria bacterium]|nr:HI0074 family nucleotidyltransferase substrate-binding subunit [Alphaproteobacteria bacterium]
MPDSTRLFERIAEYRKALARLHEVLLRAEDDVVRDSIIQRFEFSFELAWKALKLWLEFKNIDVRTPHEVLSEALRVGMIEDGNGWTHMQKERNETSHTYDEKTAKDVVLFMRQEGIALFDALDLRFTEITKEAL